MEAEARAARARAAAAAAALDAEQAELGVENKESAEDILAKMFGGKKPPEQAAPTAERKADARAETAPRMEASGDSRAAARAPSPEPDQDAEAKGSPALDLISYVFKRLIRPAAPPERAPIW